MELAVDLTPKELVTAVYLFRSARRGWLNGHGPLAITLERAQQENGCTIERAVWESLERKRVIESHEVVGTRDVDVLLYLSVSMGDMLKV